MCRRWHELRLFDALRQAKSSKPPMFKTVSSRQGLMIFQQALKTQTSGKKETPCQFMQIINGLNCFAVKAVSTTPALCIKALPNIQDSNLAPVLVVGNLSGLFHDCPVHNHPPPRPWRWGAERGHDPSKCALVTSPMKVSASKAEHATQEMNNITTVEGS